MAKEMQELEEKSKHEVASRPQLIDLVRSQDFRCSLSGVVLLPDIATLDHKIPVAEGGGHSIENLQVVHSAINRMKGTMSCDEFVRWCKLVAMWTS